MVYAAYAGVSAFFGLGLEDDHVPTFWLLLEGLGFGWARQRLEGQQPGSEPKRIPELWALFEANPWRTSQQFFVQQLF